VFVRAINVGLKARFIGLAYMVVTRQEQGSKLGIPLTGHNLSGMAEKANTMALARCFLRGLWSIDWHPVALAVAAAT